MIASRGPPVRSVYRVSGDATTNAKRKAVLSQLTVLVEVEKNAAAVFATGEKESHCGADEY